MVLPPLDESIDERFPGAAMGQNQNISHLIVRIKEAYGLLFGPTFDDGDLVELEDVEGVGNALPNKQFTGDARATMPGNASSGPPFVMRKDAPCPATVVTIVGWFA